MTHSAIPRPLPRDPAEAGEIRESDSGLALRQVAEPGVGAAIWRRSLSPGFAAWIERIPLAQLPDLRAVVDFRAVERCVHDAFDRSGLAKGMMRDLLASDIGALALLFAQIMRSPLLHLRFEAVTTDACRRFHVDQLPARLLCTYRGPGTQFGRDDPAGIIPAGEMRAGEVAILRGALWPDAQVTRLLHRSPPMAAGGVRLFLALDPAPEPANGQRLH